MRANVADKRSEFLIACGSDWLRLAGEEGDEMRKASGASVYPMNTHIRRCTLEMARMFDREVVRLIALIGP